MNLADFRREYTLAGLSRADLSPDPLQQFHKWFEEALKAQVAEPTAMTLATADALGRPSARTVLLKGADQRGFMFFTNYQSRKGRELCENPFASAVFLWREIERQICLSGPVSKLSREESKVYFESRPLESRLAAWSSNQSQVVASRAMLEQRLVENRMKFQNGEVPLPPHWGGFLIAPERIEFWQGRPSRMHDRFLYSNQPDGGWLVERLFP